MFGPKVNMGGAECTKARGQDSQNLFRKKGILYLETYPVYHNWCNKPMIYAILSVG